MNHQGPVEADLAALADPAVVALDADAGGRAVESGDDAASPGRIVRWRRVLAGLGAVGVVLVWMFVAEPFRVQSSSMAPTFEHGDRIIVNKLAYLSGSPRIGDVVVLESPDGRGLVVKRVVAVEGQTVGLEDGLLVVDGVAQVETYFDQETIDGVYFGPVDVPADTIFVMGDNRAESVDSREYGAVPLDAVVGRVSLRVWPLG